MRPFLSRPGRIRRIYGFVITNLYPELIIATPLFPIVRLLQKRLEFNITVPELMITPVLLSGTTPHAQLAGFSHAELTAPVQVTA